MKSFCKKSVIIIMSVLLIISLFACGNKRYESDMEDQNGKNIDTNQHTFYSMNASSQDDNEQKYVLNAELTCETKEFNNGLNFLNNLISESNGYIQDSVTEGKEYDTYTTRVFKGTLRIPVDTFDNFINKVENQFSVTQKNTSKENVTESYYEIESQQKSLRVQEEKLLRLMEEADSLDQILTIENQLTEIRQKIQYYDSMMNALSNQIEYTTIKITLYDVKEYTVAPEPGYGTQVKETFEESWIEFADGCKEFFLFVISSVPTLVVLGVIGGINALIIVLIVKACKKKAKEESVKASNGK